MNIPQDLMYTESHEWVNITKEEGAVIGLTDFAQHALGDIVFISLPEVGDEVIAGEPFTDLESVKAVSDIFSPVSGTIAAINVDLLDEPARINTAPYETWIIKVNPYSQDKTLLTPKLYAEVIAEEEE